MLKKNLIILTGFSFLMVACVRTPVLDTSEVNSFATPYEVTDGFPKDKGKRVNWGGQIISISNQADYTQMQVLAFPLAKDGYPNTYRKPVGRFVLNYPEFLEPDDYESGSLVTIVGTLTDLTAENIKDIEFVIPVVLAQQIQLWPRRRDYFYPSFGFGISIGL